MQHRELRSDRGSWFVNEFFLQFSLYNIHDTFKTGESSSYIFLKLVFFTNYSIKWQWDSSKRRSKWNRRRSGTENIHLGTASTNSRRGSRWLSWKIRRVSPSPPHGSLPVAGEAINDVWSMAGNFIYRHHVEPRVALYSPREESFTIPLKYFDVTRTTHTNLDVKQEKRIDDYWNIDGSRDLSDPWTGFTQFTLLQEKPPDGYMWSGVRLTRKQRASRPDPLWPELWKSRGKHAKLKEKQKWSNEKLHLENARKLWGMYFVDAEDKEFKETIKNARKKLETSVAPAMPCKIMKKNCGSGGSNKIKTKLACILEADESTRLRMGNSLPNHHEDHIAGKGDNSLQRYNSVHKFIPLPQDMTFPAAKAAMDKEWEKLRTFRRGTWRKSEVRKRWSMKQGRRAQKFILPAWWTSVIWHNAELEAKHHKYKGRVVLRGDIVKDDSVCYAVFTEQGFISITKWQQQKSWISFPGCAGQAADAVSAYTQVKMEDAHKFWKKIPNRNVQTLRFVHNETNG